MLYWTLVYFLLKSLPKLHLFKMLILRLFVPGGVCTFTKSQINKRPCVRNLCTERHCYKDDKQFKLPKMTHTVLIYFRITHQSSENSLNIQLRIEKHTSTDHYEYKL